VPVPAEPGRAAEAGWPRPTPGELRAAGGLPWQARAYRVAHLAWGVAQLMALARVWGSAAGLPRGGWYRPSVAFLGVQGVGLVIGRGDCPMTSVQRRLGDPVPMFELLLPRRAAKAAVPMLAVVAGLGLVLSLRRR
jgi:hypothetical protein